jgi:alkylated DNA repair protein alkB family protein 1
LTNVIDVENGQKPECWGQVTELPCDADGFLVSKDARLFSFSRHPGLYMMRNGLPENIVDRLAEDCFTTFLESCLATTNFNKSHGLFIQGVWHASQNNLNNNNNESGEKKQDSVIASWTRDGSGRPASWFLDNLRWTSIGPVYDWTERRYRDEDEYFHLPDYLVNVSSHVVSMISSAVGFDVCPSDFHPNAALINYYREGDKLCGHKDDAENDQTKPLVSISLGCPAIFLMGGSNKDVIPTPMILRARDIVLLSGEARQAYHGLPRIFPSVRKYPLEGGNDPPWGPQVTAHENPTPIQTYLTSCRLNVSVRQV